jgi:hypothetical protein
MSIAISISRLAGTLSSIRVAETVDISAISITNPRQHACHLIQSKLEKSILSDPFLDSNADCFGINYIQYGGTGEQLDCMR